VARGVLLLCAILFAGTSMAHAQDQSRTLSHDGQERRFVVHVPATPPLATPPSATPRALVVALHGSGQPFDELRQWLPLDAVADREGFVVAYPFAIDGRWNLEARGGIDDRGFLDAMVDRLASEGLADRRRIYLTGISRGALLSWTLLCHGASRFAAAVPISSPMASNQVADCPAPRLIPLLAIAGTADTVQPYDGRLRPPPAPRLLSIPETMEFWRVRHGCTDQTLSYIPPGSAGTPAHVERIDWTGCTSHKPVALYKVVGGEHEPPSLRRGQAIDTAEEVWRFFRDGGR